MKIFFDIKREQRFFRPQKVNIQTKHSLFNSSISWYDISPMQSIEWFQILFDNKGHQPIGELTGWENVEFGRLSCQIDE